MLKWINEKMKKRKGFTLVELVVVIAILGVLAAVAVPKLTTSRTTAANTAHNSNVAVLESAATMYIAEKGVPTTKVDWTGAKNEGSEDYIQKWPTMPKGGDSTLKDEKYTVEIDTKGKITVKPDAIILETE